MSTDAAAAANIADRLFLAPSTRDELMLLDAELREAYREATLLPDGRSRRGRKTKHDTATRRWIDAVAFPALEMGKIPPASDMAMLKLSPRSSLSGANLKARDAWSQLHGRDPRSKKQTAAERAGQETLLAWARTNLPTATSAVRRGKVASWKLDFGRWAGFSPRQLAFGSAAGTVVPEALAQRRRTVPAGAYLLWISGQTARSNKPSFKWSFPRHFYLYLAMRELEDEGRAVNGNDGPVGLALPPPVHRQYETYVDIRLTSADPDAADNSEPRSPTSPPDTADAPTAGALRAPRPPQPVDAVETATPREQVEFFKSTLTEIDAGELPPYKEWTRLQVSCRRRPCRRRRRLPRLPSSLAIPVACSRPHFPRDLPRRCARRRGARRRARRSRSHRGLHHLHHHCYPRRLRRLCCPHHCPRPFASLSLIL